MKSKLKDLSSSTGWTPQVFAKRFRILLSTLRKWEQNLGLYLDELFEAFYEIQRTVSQNLTGVTPTERKHRSFERELAGFCKF